MKYFVLNFVFSGKGGRIIFILLQRNCGAGRAGNSYDISSGTGFLNHALLPKFLFETRRCVLKHFRLSLIVPDYKSAWQIRMNFFVFSIIIYFSVVCFFFKIVTLTTSVRITCFSYMCCAAWRSRYRV